MNEKRKERTACRRKAFWNAVNVRCVVCGEAEPMFIDFHHVEKKQWKIGFLVNRALYAPLSNWPALLQQELAKTVPLCVLCHRRLHHGVVALTAEQKATRPTLGGDWLNEHSD